VGGVRVEIIHIVTRLTQFGVDGWDGLEKTLILIHGK
jgi:hypothetical protein